MTPNARGFAQLFTFEESSNDKWEAFSEKSQGCCYISISTRQNFRRWLGQHAKESKNKANKQNGLVFD
jgi:hypothetical protein